MLYSIIFNSERKEEEVGTLHICVFMALFMWEEGKGDGGRGVMSESNREKRGGIEDLYRRRSLSECLHTCNTRFYTAHCKRKSTLFCSTCHPSPCLYLAAISSLIPCLFSASLLHCCSCLYMPCLVPLPSTMPCPHSDTIPDDKWWPFHYSASG